MPELPEVQTLITNLKEEDIVGKKIIDFELIKPKVLKNSNLKELKTAILGCKIEEVSRIGKYIIIHLSNGKYITIHLRMEGKLFLGDKEVLKPNKHTMFIVDFGKTHLLYNDTRMFGTLHYYKSREHLDNSKELSKVGLDALDQKFTTDYLYNRIKKVNRYIKTTLLDQSIVAGIGNIYADEILYASGISPLRKASKITKEDCGKIVKETKRILKKAIDNKGTTIFSYLYKPNHSGQFQNMLKVHTKKGWPCERCKTKIGKIKVNGRGTYYCKGCQK